MQESCALLRFFFTPIIFFLQVIEIVRCLDKTVDGPAVKTLSSELVADDHPFFGQRQQGIGDLEFAVFPRFGLLDDAEDLGREDVAADDGKV